MKKKIVAAALACVLCVGLGIGGTLAWLSASSSDVVNTFTIGDINIKLDEAPIKTDANGNVVLDKEATRVTSINTYKMIPGTTLPKDPTATVLAKSEDCWLFVKIVESANFDDYMTYGIATGWTALDGNPGVYYRAEKVAYSEKDQPFGILDKDQVTVKEGVTKSMMEEAKDNLPTLTFKAFAHQYANVDFSTASEAAVEYFNKNP